ncbi:SGNH/GDSL hydrolase family protein [Microbacterium paludicola]|uniref:SGNH/GDSL hydrolase family protein n=1 Tax=Microbacterium paludicola TaxID=300019 RepID=UPI0011A4E3C6|nr:SGNH/GDSL hydrolase family protein [Microbacterium paludicola]
MAEKVAIGNINGRSAYQVAVDGGFSGTEAEWLDSLKGDVTPELEAARVAAVGAAEEAADHAAAVQAVTATNDGIMAAVAADEESEFGGQLRNTIAEGIANADISGEVVATGDARYARGLNVTNLAGLRRWEVALADAENSNAVITVMGDSITWGVGSDGNALGDQPGAWDAFRSFAWPVQLRKMLARRTGIPVAENFIGITSGWDYATIAGTASSSPSIGPFGGYTVGGAGGRSLDGSGSTVTIPATKSGTFTDLDVWIWGTGSGVSNPRKPGVSVDAGLQIAAASTPAADFHRLTVSGLADSTHEIVISGFSTSGSGLSYVSHVVTRYSRGIVVNRVGRSGATMQDASGGTQADTARARAIKASVMPGFTNLLIISLGTNDHGAQVPIADYKSRMQEVITEAVNGGACVLLLGEAPAANGSSTTITENAYRNAMRELALANTHVAFTDTRDLFGGRTAAFGEGLFPTSSTVHPSRRGHGLIARSLFELLTQARMS